MDENFKQEWSLLKIIAPTITFLGIIFYFVPISRSYFRKGCLIFIDAIAFSLKTILNSFETDSKFVNYSYGNIKLQNALKNNVPKEKYKKSSLKTSTKNLKDFKKVKEKNIDWPEMKIYPSRGFEFSRESIGDLKSNKLIMNKKNNDTLYLENDRLASNYSQYFSSGIQDVQNSHKLKKNKYKRKRSDVYRSTDQNLAEDDEEYEEEEEEREEREEREEQEEREGIEENDKEIEYKLRKIRKKILSLSIDKNKNQRQRKEFEALKLIDDLLKNNNYNNKINNRLKNIKNNNDKKTGYESLVVDGNKTYDNADGSWSGRKSTAASTRKELSGASSCRSNRQEILHTDYYDLSDDSDDFLPPPIINDTNVDKMTTNAIRGIRRKKSSLCEVKVAVIGAPGVGKSALTVRFLTRRYIGEYDHQQENRYKHEVLVDGEPILFEILDSCPKSQEEMPTMETLQWADGLLLVYSITDRGSFNFVRKAKQALAVADPEAAMPLALVGNKADMVHLRQVSTEEGEILAKDFECWFSEVTAAEQVVQIAESFHELCREVLAARRRNKQSLLDRMLGSKATKAYSRGKSDSALPKD